MSRNPLTAAERNKIFKLRQDGLSLANIAKELHRGKQTIVDVIKNLDGSKQIAKTEGYRELKVTPKKETKTFIRVDYPKATAEKSTTKLPTDEDDFNKVPLEYRAVIKFLTKNGQNSREIYAGMKKVYNEATPSLPIITHWSGQFRKGRETIVNEPKPKLGAAKTPRVAKVKVAKPVKPWMWAKKPERKKSRSASSIKIKKSSSVRKLKMKSPPPADKLTKSVSSSRLNVKRIGSDPKKKLITIKFPVLKKLKMETK